MRTEPRQQPDDTASESTGTRIPFGCIFAFVVLSLGAGFIASQILALRGEQEQVLPDGSRVSLGPVVHGTATEYPRPWLLWAASNVHRELHKMFGFKHDPILKHSASHERLGIHIWSRGPVSTPSFYDLHGVVVDENGWTGQLWPGNPIEVREQHWLVQYGTHGSIPRTSREFQMELRDSTKGSPGPVVVSFRFPNPSYNPSVAPITTQTISLTSVDRDIEVRLRHLKSGVRYGFLVEGLREETSDSATLARYMTGDYEVPQPGELQATIAPLEVFQNGAPTIDYSVNSITVHDPYGNAFPTISTTGIPHKGVLFPFTHMLWADEGAWNLDVELARENNFPPGSTFVFETTIPPEGTLPESTAATHASEPGIYVTFHGLTGAGARVMYPRGGYRILYHPALSFTIETDGDYQPRLSAQLTTSTATEVSTFSHEMDIVKPGELMKLRYGICLPDRSNISPGTSITLTLKLAEKRRVTFTAVPEMVTRR